MKKTPLIWKIKGKWYTARQTYQQFGHWMTGRTLTPQGNEAYDYYCKVIFDAYEPVSYAELMYEDELKNLMKAYELDRKSAAILSAGQLAKGIPPWDFWKKSHKIISG